MYGETSSDKTFNLFRNQDGLVFKTIEFIFQRLAKIDLKIYQVIDNDLFDLINRSSQKNYIGKKIIDNFNDAKNSIMSALEANYIIIL
jgi:hypothetical protein